MLLSVPRNGIAENSIKSVSYGRRPITGEAEGLVKFKESMGFKKVLVKERVEINPLAKALFSAPLGLLTSLFAKYLSGIPCMQG